MTPTTEELAALVKRLRNVPGTWRGSLLSEAADAIEALGGELAEANRNLREQHQNQLDLLEKLHEATVTLNRSQAQAILDYIDQGEADVETEVLVGYREEGKDTDGEDAPAGVYMWDAEYPEEGAMYLSPKP